MNSLEQLNGFSNESIIFTDDRPFSVTATTDGLPQTGVSIVEDASTGFSAFGVTITNMTSADDTTANHITLTFDFSSETNPKVNWPTAPRAIQFSEPTPGVFVASKIQLIEDYEFILNNTTVKLVDQAVNFLYTVNASWPGTSHTQTFNALMTATPETNLNGLTLQMSDYNAQTLFDLAQFNPSIVDSNNDSTYDLQLTSSLGATLSLGLGTPASSINITGDKSTVDALLDTVYYYPDYTDADQTDSINYTLTVTNGTLGNYVSETGNFTNYIPLEVTFHNFDNRTYVGNSINNSVFTADWPYITDLVDPTRTLVLAIAATSGTLIKGQGITSPYSNTLTLTGTAAQINLALRSTADPIGIIPQVNSSTETLTFTVAYNATILNTETLTFDRTSTASYGPTVYTSDFTITENEYYYAKMDALLVAGAGGGGTSYASGNQQEADAGGGGDGVAVLFNDFNLSNLAKDQQFFVFEVGTGGAAGTGGNTSSEPVTDGDNGTDSVIYTSNTPSTQQNLLYFAHGGGGGGAARSYYLATLGGSFANSGVATGGCGGGGGAAAHRDSNQTPPVVENEAPGGVAGVGYVSNGVSPTSLSVNSGNAGQVFDQPGSNPDWIANGGDGGVATLTSNITGTSITYRAAGGAGGAATAGADGTIIVRIEAR